MWNWIRRPRVLHERGVLGMNRRNAELIGPHNSRSAMRAVDDKLELHRLCVAGGIPSPRVFATFDCIASLRTLPARLAECESAVLKPARGSGGRGVLVLDSLAADRFQTTNGSVLTWSHLMDHAADILAGIHSLGGRPDAVLVQERLRPHPDLADVSVGGVPDVRVIVYRGNPAMAMLRLPTRQSGGRANLHQGGIGVGIDMTAGITTHALHGRLSVQHHPDTGEMLLGRRIPDWPEILGCSRLVAEFVGIAYCGVDVVLDLKRGPLVLEVNARPGLAIQLVNRAGLIPRFETIERAMRAGRSGGPSAFARVA